MILYSRGKGKELKDAEQGCIADTLTKSAYFAGSETASGEVKNRGAAVAIAPNREGSKLSTSQIKGKVYRMQWPLGDESHLYRLY